MKNKIQYYYVHGLHSSKKAQKFIEIQINHPNAICFEWTIQDNLYNKINEWTTFIKESRKETVLIGSSTGSNLICQMNKLLAQFNIFPKTILINPLLDLNQVINKEIIPVELIKYIRHIDHFCNYLLIISDNDEVLDHRLISSNILQSNEIIISKDDDHKLSKFKNYLDEIKCFIDKHVV